MVDATVFVITYNHAKYVSLCFQSILQQNTKRRLQIVWHDDASTDDTIAIGEENLLNCPHEVVRIHRQVNSRLNGDSFMPNIFERSSGKYIFWLEGDDFWISTDKVDLQIDALDLHPHVNICFTPAFIVSGMNADPTGVMARHANIQTLYTLDQVILGDGGFMPSPSLCFRRNFLDVAPEWIFESVPVFDYPLQVLTSSPGGALYLPDITCGYRSNAEESWTSRVFNNPPKRMIFEAEFISMLLQLHKTLPGHRGAIVQLAFNHLIALLGLSISLNDYSDLEKALLALKEIN